MADGDPWRKGERMVLAVAVGLSASLALGGGGLLWSGYRTSSRPFDCAELGPGECAMEQEIALAGARHQVGLGLILLSLGTAMSLALWLTERRRSAPPRSDA